MSFLDLMDLNVLRNDDQMEKGKIVMDSLFRLANLIRNKSE